MRPAIELLVEQGLKLGLEPVPECPVPVSIASVRPRSSRQGVAGARVYT